MEACAFFGEILSALPTPENAHSAITGIDSFETANLVVAFMNARWEGMKAKLLSIPGYDEQCYRCMQTHFVEAVPAFLNYKNDSKARFYPSLFETWNLYTELGIVENNGMPTGAISRKNIVGTELNDVMYVSGTYDLGIAIYVYGVSGNNEIHCGPTETRVEGGDKGDEIYSYQGNDTISPNYGNNVITMVGHFPIWKMVIINNGFGCTDRIKEFDNGNYNLQFVDGYIDYQLTEYGILYICPQGNKVIVEQVKYA